MTRTLLVAALMAAFAPAFAAAQAPTPAAPVLSLEQAIATALANNSELRMAALAMDDARQQVNLTWAEVMPTVTAALNYSRSIELPVNFLPGEFFGQPAGTLIPVKFGADNSWQGGFTVNQTLFRGDALVGIASEGVYKEAARENHRATAQRTVTNVRVAYYAVLLAEARFMQADQSIARLKSNLAENRARQAAGTLDEYEVLRLEVLLANEEPARHEARNALAEAYRALNLAMGLPVDTPFRVSGDLVAFDLFAEADAANAGLTTVDRAVPFAAADSTDLSATRGDLRALDVQRRLQNRQIFALRTRYLPELSLTYQRQWSAAFNGDARFPGEDATGNSEWNRFQVVAVNVSVPLFNGFRRVTNLKRAHIERRVIEERIRYAEQSARNEVVTTSTALERIFETAASRRQAVSQAERGYTIASARFRNGVGSQLDVTEAEFQYRLAQLNYAALVFEYLSTKARYDLAVGIVPFVDTRP